MLHDCWLMFRETGDPLCYLIGRRLESGVVSENVRMPENDPDVKTQRPERKYRPG
ncbi:MAG: hypothetical protein Q4A39_02690 [Eubacteriales bacterium]|nr:hypothetical protein [Eubacteriales bacterium]